MTAYSSFGISWENTRVEDPNIGFPAINLSLPKSNDISKPQNQPMNEEITRKFSETAPIIRNAGIAMVTNAEKGQITSSEMTPIVSNSEIAPTANIAKIPPMLTNIMMPMTNIFTEHFLSFNDKNQMLGTHQPQTTEEKCNLPSGVFNLAPITEYLIDESEFVINGTNFECQLCGYTISSKRRYMMKNHILAEHKGVRHKCKDCNYEGKSREKLNAHMKRVHFGISSNPQIMEYFIDDSEFVIKDSNFECQHCGYKISNKRRYMMKNHILSEHKGVRHKCNECNYEGKSREKLNAHMKRVHFGISSNPYVINDGTGHQCDKCDFRTNRGMYELNLHIQAEHEGIKHFCSKCSFSSKRKDIVQRHMKQKHLGIVFRCDMCSYTSSWKYSLQRHVARSHGADSGIQKY